MEKKVYLVGNFGFDYLNWILDLPEWEYTKNINEASAVFFTGGEDVSPWVYGDPKGSFTCNNESRDNYEIEFYKKAKSLNLPCIGVCRGGQFLTAMNGGKLCQHSSHPSLHTIKTNDGKKLQVTSSHHQQFIIDSRVTGLKENEDYILIGWAENISKYHLDGEDKDFNFGPLYREPEIVFFSKSKDLCYQMHPEWMALNHPTVKYCQQIFQKYIN